MPRITNLSCRRYSCCRAARTVLCAFSAFEYAAYAILYASLRPFSAVVVLVSIVGVGFRNKAFNGGGVVAALYAHRWIGLDDIPNRFQFSAFDVLRDCLDTSCHVHVRMCMRTCN